MYITALNGACSDFMIRSLLTQHDVLRPHGSAFRAVRENPVDMHSNLLRQSDWSQITNTNLARTPASPVPCTGFELPLKLNGILWVQFLSYGRSDWLRGKSRGWSDWIRKDNSEIWLDDWEIDRWVRTFLIPDRYPGHIWFFSKAFGNHQYIVYI